MSATFDVVPYQVRHGNLTGAEGWIVLGRCGAVIRLRDHHRTNSDENVIDALLKQAEDARQPDVLGPIAALATVPPGAP
ncbi:hypothetical protein Rctr197k_189 [Virus Rctr197k]|nr:hypothetical protein Rctr197k_189 [Virus Rctr197k]